MLQLALFDSACQFSAAGLEDKITQTNAVCIKDDVKQMGHANEPKFAMHHVSKEVSSPKKNLNPSQFYSTFANAVKVLKTQIQSPTTEMRKTTR